MTRLPDFLQAFFWDCDFAALSLEAQRDFSIRRLLQAGSWQALSWLRAEVGDEAFFKIMTTWAADNALANASTDDFLDLVERSDGAETRRLVEAWLTDPQPP